MAGSHDLRTPDHEPEFTFFYPFFSGRSRFGHAPWIGSRRLRCIRRIERSLLYGCFFSLGSALVFFDGVSVGIGIITSVSLYVAYLPEDTRNSGMV